MVHAMFEIRRSSGIDDEVVQDQRQRDDNDLPDERQDQSKEEEVEPRRGKRARTEKSFGPKLFLLCYKMNLLFIEKRCENVDAICSSLALRSRSPLETGIDAADCSRKYFGQYCSWVISDARVKSLVTTALYIGFYC
ncbi:hypothetical protein Tco_0686491 [Tanacetum coccineum]